SRLPTKPRKSCLHSVIQLPIRLSPQRLKPLVAPGPARIEHSPSSTFQFSFLTMNYIEPHAHMVSRVTDDYIKLKLAGCQAVCEPAFWAGFDRSSPAGFHDYFSQLTEHEPKR